MPKKPAKHFEIFFLKLVTAQKYYLCAINWIGTQLQSYSPLLPGSEHLVQNLPNDNYEKISGTENHPMKLFRVESKQFFVQSSELGVPKIPALCRWARRCQPSHWVQYLPNHLCRKCWKPTLTERSSHQTWKYWEICMEGIANFGSCDLSLVHR